jgi:hypothetical protein
VIAFQPDLEKILKPPVFRHILGRQMAMIIQNRLVFGELVVEPPRGLGVEQEIFVDKGHKDGQKLIETHFAGGVGAARRRKKSPSFEADWQAEAHPTTEQTHRPLRLG